MAQKPNKQQLSSHRKALYILLPFLLVAISLGAFFVIQHKLALQKEEKNFMQLKQDMLSLQKEFNKIDAGWVLDDGCYDNGQVYGYDSAEYCEVRLYILNQRRSLEEERSIFNVYHETLNSSNRFIMSSEPKVEDYIDYSDEGNYLKVKHTNVSVRIQDKASFANCFFESNTEIGKYSWVRELRCGSNARKFYFEHK